MRFISALTALTLTLGLGLSACTAAPVDSQDAAHTETGALGFAPPIAYGETVTGQIASPQIDVWALDVQAGDQLRLIKTVTGGDLKPDIVLFQGNGSSHVSSTSYDVTPTSLSKDYTLDRNARFFVVVRGYEGQGSGSYSLSATCLGGPCAGEVPPPPVVELEDQEKQECIMKARECAVAKLPAYNGAVGAVRAQQVFDGCLGETTIETWHSDVPASCAPACQDDEAAEVCQGIVSMLPWLADQTSACVGEFNSCVEQCYDASDGTADESVEYGGEAVCVTGWAAFNGSCGDVEQLQICGGRWGEDSCEACYLGCHYTIGAWIDDLDTICDEECNCDPSEDFYY